MLGDSDWPSSVVAASVTRHACIEPRLESPVLPHREGLNKRGFGGLEYLGSPRCAMESPSSTLSAAPVIRIVVCSKFLRKASCLRIDIPQMADSTNLAGVIGTWVAVALALIALLGIVGPVLVWRAVRAEKNRALQDAGAEPQPFIGRGFRFVGTNVRIFRRIRVPLLDKTPPNKLEPLKWDISRYEDTRSHASWVQLVYILCGYGVQFARGDNLIVFHGKAILPLHRVWLLVVGLLGRYSFRVEAPTMDRRLSRRLRPSDVRFDLSHAEESSDLGDNISDSDAIPSRVRTRLNGNSGQILITERVTGLGVEYADLIQFVPRSQDGLSVLDKDDLPLHDLLMMAFGCLPLQTSGQYITFLEMWSSDSVEEAYQYDEGLHPLPVEDTLRRRSHMSAMVSRSEQVKQKRTRSLNRVWSAKGRARDLVALRLEKVDDRDDDMDRLNVNGVLGIMKRVIWAFEPQKLDARLSADLTVNIDVSFVDPFLEWVRLPTHQGVALKHTVFIWRTDAQKIAHALLKLTWSSQGYLIGGSSSLCSIQLLEVAGGQLLYLVGHIRENLADLTIPHRDANELRELFSDAERAIRKEQSGAALHSLDELCALDTYLQKAAHSDHTVNDMIGVLVLTNEEFVSFVRQSARHFKQSIGGSITVEMRTATVKVGLPFGGSQDFPVDMKALQTDWRFRDDTITVTYTALILACTRACLRSYLLSIREDGHPLLKRILEMDDVIYVA